MSYLLRKIWCYFIGRIRKITFTTVDGTLVKQRLKDYEGGSSINSEYTLWFYNGRPKNGLYGTTNYYAVTKETYESFNKRWTKRYSLLG